MAFIKRMLKILLANLLVMATILTIAETGAIFWHRHIASNDAFLEVCTPAQFASFGYLRSETTGHPYLGNVPRPGHPRVGGGINSLGFRGPEFPSAKPDGEIRIVCIGGSTTFDDGIELDSDTYPRRLEQIMREQEIPCIVINAGVPDWSSFEYLINFPLRLQHLEPDLLLFMDCYNDILIRLVQPGTYASDNSGAKAFYYFDEPWYEVFTLGRIYSTQIRHETSQMEQAAFRHAPTRISLSSFANRETGSLREILHINQPHYFRSNIRNLVLMAHGGGTQCLLMSAPFARDPKAMAVGLGLQLTDSIKLTMEYGEAVDEMNVITRNIAEETGANFYDLAANYPDVKEDYETLYLDPIHMNPAGSAEKARLISVHLIESGIIEAIKARRQQEISPSLLNPASVSPGPYPADLTVPAPSPSPV